MPKELFPLVGLNESVSRMVIADLTSQVKKMVGLDHVDDTRIRNYNGTIRTFQTDVGNDNDLYASFTGRTRILVEAEENVNVDGWSTANVGKKDPPPFIVDTSIGLYVLPELIPTEIVIKFKFQTRSQDEAHRWHADMVAYQNMMREGSQHRLTHHVCLSPVVLELLRHIHGLRENFQGHGENFQEYIQNHSYSGITLISAADGEQPVLAFSRTLDRVNGRFDVSPLPEKPAFIESGGVWECVLNYKAIYDRPTHCSVVWPIQVHQQLLDDKYIIPNNYPSHHLDRQKDLTLTQQAFSIFESYKILGYSAVQDACIRIPAFDDYKIRSAPKSTATILLGLLNFQEKGEQIALNLKELGDEEIDPDILQFFSDGEWKYLASPFKSFFYLSLYRGDDLVRSESLRCDEDLNVWITSEEDINLRASYRIRLSVVVDSRLLNIECFRRMFHKNELIVKVVNGINDAVRHNVDLLDRLNLRPLKEYEFTNLWWTLNGLSPLPIYTYGSALGGPKNPGKTFGIPDHVYESISRTFTMRTVQIQGTFVKRK